MITGVILARNEEGNILNCLQSLERHVSEIILIDMESSDRTLELATPYVDKILPHPLVNNFDAARNTAIPEASFEWMWFVDADEWVSDSVGRHVTRFIRERGHECEGLNIPFQSYFCGHWMQHCGWWPGYTCPRVLKRGYFEFSRTLHGGVHLQGRELLFPPSPEYAIPHYSFRSVEHWVEKANRYTTTECLQLVEHGQRWDWRLALRMMVHDLWEHYEKHDARLDGDRGWIHTWLSSQYRWLSVAKLIDLSEPRSDPDSSLSVPGNLDEVLLAMEQELASFRLNSVDSPLGIVLRGKLWSKDVPVVREVAFHLAERRCHLTVEAVDDVSSAINARDAAFLTALARSRRAKHVITIAIGDLDVEFSPDPYAVANVLVLTKIQEAEECVDFARWSGFDEIYVGSDQVADSAARISKNCVSSACTRNCRA